MDKAKRRVWLLHFGRRKVRAPRSMSPTLGFSLVEVTLALGIAAFCLVTVFALLPVGLNSNQTSANQTTASSIARSVVGDLRGTAVSHPAADATSPLYHLVIPAAAGTATHTLFLNSAGAVTGPVDGNAISGDPNTASLYRVMVTFNSAAGIDKPVTKVHLFVTWPALADPQPSTGSTVLPSNPPKNYAGFFEVATAINRN